MDHKGHPGDRKEPQQQRRLAGSVSGTRDPRSRGRESSPLPRHPVAESPAQETQQHCLGEGRERPSPDTSGSQGEDKAPSVGSRTGPQTGRCSWDMDHLASEGPSPALNGRGHISLPHTEPIHPCFLYGRASPERPGRPTSPLVLPPNRPDSRDTHKGTTKPTWVTGWTDPTTTQDRAGPPGLHSKATSD